MSVIEVQFERAHLQEMAEKIRDIIYSYSGRISLAEAVGILEICKMELLEEQKKYLD